MKEKEFEGVDIFTGEMPTKPSESHQSGLVAIEQSRAMAEVQAAMLMARMNPRDEYTAYERIKKACRRKSLAESAAYAYSRGGKIVTGPTIRLAEVLASHWTNMTYGLRELSRKTGSSEIEAFAWDLETNTRVVRTFVVNHIRDKKSGNVALTSERDVYELVANMGQRRVRACILELIPGDIVEAAEKQCEETLKKDEKPLEDRIRDLMITFSDLGVTKEMLETHLGHPLKGMVIAQFVKLMQIYRSLRDGIAKREDFFSLKPADEPPLSVDDRFHKEFIFHKHEATKTKTNEHVTALAKKLGITEMAVKTNALENPDAFHAEIKAIMTTTSPSTASDSTGEPSAPQNEEEIPPDTGEPSPREKAIISAKEMLDSIPSEQREKFWIDFKKTKQFEDMPLDDQGEVRAYYEKLSGE